MLNVVDWSAIAALISAVIAAGALVFGVLSFRSQQKWAVRPYFWVSSTYYTNEKAVILCNNGVGPAVIEHAEFSKDGRTERRIVDLLDLGHDFSWNTFTALPKGRVIPPQGEVVLLKLSLSHLEAQGIDPKDASKIMNRLEDQRVGTRLRIEYKDIYGKRLPTFTKTLGPRSSH